MYGVERTTNAAGMVRAPFGPGGVSPAPTGRDVKRESVDPLSRGPLSAARDVLQRELASTGFVDVTGPLSVNFEAYLNRSPVELDHEDLRPGVLNDVASWVAGKLGIEPQRALDAQANVRREAALKLLT